jgi:hypothetical protein
MLVRLLATSALLISLQISFPADTDQNLRERYGPPISENFLVRPGVIATATYGTSGHVCQIVVSPQRLWNSTIGSVNVGDLLDELVPPSERGKYVSGGFADAECFPTNDCSGSFGVWENVDMFRNGATANEHYIRIHWRRKECDVPPSK